MAAAAHAAVMARGLTAALVDFKLLVNIFLIRFRLKPAPLFLYPEVLRKAFAVIQMGVKIGVSQ